MGLGVDGERKESVSHAVNFTASEIHAEERQIEYVARIPFTSMTALRSSLQNNLKMTPPTPQTIHAFGLSGIPLPLPGGRELCYLVSNTVFKPSDDPNETKYVSELATSLLLRSPTAYRLARPLPVLNQPSENKFVFNRWTAFSFFSGETEKGGDFEEILRVSRAFHADLAELVSEKPAFIARRSNRWCEADMVTWDEKKLEEVQGVDEEIIVHLRPILEKLVLARELLAETVKSQLIHADLAGNVLFHKEEPPAIIDLTLYWRPTRYAEEIIVVDGLTWHGKGRELIRFYGSDELGSQMLVRALYWRCLTWAIDPDLKWIRSNLVDLVERYKLATEMVCDLFGS